MVREAAKMVGLSVYDKPSNSCLASRIPWGQSVTAERLARIEIGEKLSSNSQELSRYVSEIWMV
uniref:ExsB family protein n=1 Tax=uncultured marine thaumarchaeote AD1000_45_G09 TaxID=1455919 RepID=A0A075FXM6_9ARCH|nr:ExsB family protein [uncultured marine thaumarchaeote AD1000_45_G09]